MLLGPFRRGKFVLYIIKIKEKSPQLLLLSQDDLFIYNLLNQENERNKENAYLQVMSCPIWIHFVQDHLITEKMSIM